MNARAPALLRTDLAAASSWQARLRLGFEARGERTALVERIHEGPLRLQKALYPEGERICHGIVLHPPAGIAGGDVLDVSVSVHDKAHALITTPGAGKWYRSLGAEGVLRQHLSVAAGGVLEWLPQENIVFRQANARLVTEIDLAPDACLFAMEMTAFGRHGEDHQFHDGRFAQSMRIRRDGRTLWREQGRVDGGHRLMHAASGLDGQRVTGTFIAAGPGLNDALVERCREISITHGDGGITLLPDLFIARYLGDRCEAGRDWFAALWGVLRPALTGQEARIPRIWKT
ncbi:urease accessory protein UreD [Nitrogeniibacter aestuarii]|uniref:urease accessory protein UreD n=1 Tax=Nitrogeniibacter aestuarii TaxID=2815343 RepID=UPI001D1060B1|nr:urease accessory protein UreD [Nitrogeniibacter aestuarii]